MDVCNLRRAVALAGAVIGMIGTVGTTGHADGIGVTVNGVPVSFSGTPPTEVHGSVLVPLRGVFEAMGASVDYDGASRTIYAKKGLTNVTLPVGSSTATVNGATRVLSQPAQVVGGTTLVPLRFVAEAFGGYVEWHAANSTVEIQTQEPHLATLPPPPVSDTGVIIGQLNGIYPNTNPPRITLRVNGETTTVPLSRSTIILRSTPDQPGIEVPLNRLNVGDQVSVQRSDDGTAASIASTYGEVRGTVKSIGRLSGGGSVITLNDGITVELTEGAPVTMAGRKIRLSDVMADETVVIRTNPSNHYGYAVAVVTDDNLKPAPGAGVSGIPSTGATVAVAVTSFTHDADRPLRAGDLLTARLNGTPGGKATFSIPGIAEDIPMREYPPGVYFGTVKIPRGVAVNGAAVLGQLVANGTASPLIQAATPVTIDSAAPKLADISPANGDAVDNDTPLIYATISDFGGSGVDPDATKIMLDGKDVTGQATVTGAFFNLRPSAPLAPGPHMVRVTLADRAGNTASRDIPFSVTANRTVQSFTSDADSAQPIRAGKDIRFNLAATPGGRASFNIGSSARDIPMTETSPGVYEGRYTVPQGESATNVPVTAKFTAKNGRTATATLNSGLTIVAGRPLAPVISEPGNGAGVAEEVTIRGTAAPHDLIRVKVDYVSKALGGILAIRGSAGTTEVTTDDKGKWSTNGISLHTNSILGNDRDTVFTISAVAVNPNGEESAPASVEVRRS